MVVAVASTSIAGTPDGNRVKLIGPPSLTLSDEESSVASDEQQKNEEEEEADTTSGNVVEYFKNLSETNPGMVMQILSFTGDDWKPPPNAAPKQEQAQVVDHTMGNVVEYIKSLSEVNPDLALKMLDALDQDEEKESDSKTLAKTGINIERSLLSVLKETRQELQDDLRREVTEFLGDEDKDLSPEIQSLLEGPIVVKLAEDKSVDTKPSLASRGGDANDSQNVSVAYTQSSGYSSDHLTTGSVTSILNELRTVRQRVTDKPASGDYDTLEGLDGFEVMPPAGLAGRPTAYPTDDDDAWSHSHFVRVGTKAGEEIEISLSAGQQQLDNTSTMESEEDDRRSPPTPPKRHVSLPRIGLLSKNNADASADKPSKGKNSTHPSVSKQKDQQPRGKQGAAQSMVRSFMSRKDNNFTAPASEELSNGTSVTQESNETPARSSASSHPSSAATAPEPIVARPSNKRVARTVSLKQRKREGSGKKNASEPTSEKSPGRFQQLRAVLARKAQKNDCEETAASTANDPFQRSRSLHEPNNSLEPTLSLFEMLFVEKTDQGSRPFNFFGGWRGKQRRGQEAWLQEVLQIRLESRAKVLGAEIDSMQGALARVKKAKESKRRRTQDGSKSMNSQKAVKSATDSAHNKKQKKTPQSPVEPTKRESDRTRKYKSKQDSNANTKPEAKQAKEPSRQEEGAVMPRVVVHVVKKNKRGTSVSPVKRRDEGLRG